RRPGSAGAKCEIILTEVEPNRRYQFMTTPNDPDFTKQWGLNNTGQSIVNESGIAGADINAIEGWDIEQGFSNTVTVAVIDSGIDLNHPDLAGKLWKNTLEIPGNEIDDDSNGYVDDVNGFNFAGITQGWFTITNGLESITGHKYEFSQSIKGTGTPITSVGLGLVREGIPTGDINVSVKERLEGPDLATGTIEPLDVGTTPSLVDAQLSQPVQLGKDQTYYLVFSTQSTTDAADRYLLYEYYDPYTAGNYREGMMHWKVGNDWLNFSEYDFTFSTGGTGAPHDDNGHGTHVSGIVAASTDNAIGISGVSPGAKIMALKAGDSGGGFYTNDLIDSIHYAADNGADVINMSLGGSTYSSILQQAVNYAAYNNVTIVAAAGNSGPGTISYPASFDNVISVGATDNNDVVAEFSSTNSFVDFAAPGKNIYSTMPTYTAALNSAGYSQNYDYVSGTSMASPMVAGVAALILAKKPAVSPVGVEKAIEKGIDDLGPIGRDEQYGFGRVNIAKMFNKLLLNTTLVVNPAQPNGNDGWYTTTPTIGLQPNLSNAMSFYSWDTTVSPTTFTVDFQPASGGTHTLNYYSRTSSSTETWQSQDFKVDTGLPIDPTTVSSPSHTIGAMSKDNTIDANFLGATDTVSGVSGYAVSWSVNTTEVPTGPATVSALSDKVTSVPLNDGIWWFNLSTEDNAGNRTATVHLGPFTTDVHAPVGSIAINSGASKTNSTKVSLALTAPDGSGTGVDKMRFKNYGGAWSAWEAFSSTKNWKLTSTNGTKKVWAQFKDKVGNVSASVYDQIKLDTKAPVVKLVAPKVSTNISKTTKFKVSWRGTDPSPGTGIKTYDVQSKVAGGSWTNWRTGTKAKRSTFKGVQGRTNYFRARSRDNAGNVGGWSRARRTIVPYDNNRYLQRRNGFKHNVKTSKGSFYLNSVRYSVKEGDTLVYRFSGRSVKLISTKAPSRSKAKIYIDGRYVKTIDNHASKVKFRKIVFSKSWKKKKSHNLKIVNLGTPGRSLFDVDALAITR
ncbi:MAG TPA: hypothetical protein ENI11_03260, partial [Actinobacteria bacterium]|nr:hypothetical protein [Actinomycetota bacterium]